MRRFGFVIVLIVLLVIGCGLIVQKLREVTIEPPPRTVPVHLPSKCQPFYNDGTGRWAECMGVGPI